MAAEKELFASARQVLEKNWRGTYTSPSPQLYPHQWSWDSAFVAIGYSHYAQVNAQRELVSIFEGQWANGMLPHIVFRSASPYFPGPEYWQIALSRDAPRIETSGITQPAVHAIAALEIYRNAGDRQSARGFLKEIFPRILAFHRYLFTRRDPEESGLITIFHPWESGLDNSVRWDEALARIRVEGLPQYERLDTRRVDPVQRPSDDVYDRFIYLTEIMKHYRYDDEAIYEKIPFKIKDIVFSSIAYRANQSLAKIADIIGEGKNEIESWIGRTQEHYFDYFCSRETEYRLVYDFDLVSGRRIEKRTAASLISLYTDLLSQEQAATTVEWMQHAYYCTELCAAEHAVITSVSVDSPDFNPFNYWRGPVWININWMLYNGLKQYGFSKDAELLRKALIDLVAEHGFHEYYNPLSGDGLGASDFSWTAALLIDLLPGSRAPASGILNTSGGGPG